MVRKNKEYDRYDTCLSEGRKYFVVREEFKEHLEEADTHEPALSNKVCRCVIGNYTVILNP